MVARAGSFEAFFSCRGAPSGEDAVPIDVEEFFAYGRSSDRRDARARYRYIGVERDEETGLCMTGPRTYDPVVGRFHQGDPLLANRSPYAYSRANPIQRVDGNGYQDVPSDATPATPEAIDAAEPDHPKTTTMSRRDLMRETRKGGRITFKESGDALSPPVRNQQPGEGPDPLVPFTQRGFARQARGELRSLIRRSEHARELLSEILDAGGELEIRPNFGLHTGHTSFSPVGGEGGGPKVTIELDPYSDLRVLGANGQPISSPMRETLGHELAHGAHMRQGIEPPEGSGPHTPDELAAIYHENQIRADLNRPERAAYYWGVDSTLDQRISEGVESWSRTHRPDWGRR